MNNFFALYEKIFEILNSLIVIFIGLAVVGFLWGIVKILFNPGNEILKKEGKAYMIYGVLTLFVMVSVWGLVNLLANTLIVQ